MKLINSKYGVRFVQHVIRVAMNPSQVLIIPVGLIIVAIHATKNWADVHS